MKSLCSVGPGVRALPLLAALVACGGVPPKPAELALEGPSSVNLTWGGSEAIPLTLERNATATGDLTLSVEGLPAGVTARFEPETVSGDAATLHLEAARDASTEVSLVTIRASGPEVPVAEHALLLQVRGLTVTGTLASIFPDRPPAGVGVKVGTEWVATDGNGTFVAHNVAVPYDLVVRGPEMTEVYVGLSTPTPHVTGFYDELTLDSRRIVEVNLTLSPTPAVGERITVCASTTRTVDSNCRVLNGNGSNNSLYLWAGLTDDPTAPRQLVARRYTVSPSGETTGFTGEGSVDLPYAPGQYVPVDLSLSPASSTAVPYALELPEGMASPAVSVQGRVTFGDFMNGPHAVDADVIHLPDGATGALRILVSEAAGDVTLTHQPVNGPLEGPITFLSPLRALSPAQGETLTPETVFQTGDPQGGLVTHIFQGQTGGRLYFVHTFEDRVALADLRAHIEDLHPWDVSHWRVMYMKTVTTPEQAAEELTGYFAYVSYTSLSGAVPQDAGRVQVTMTYPRTFNVPPGASSAPSMDDPFEALLPR